MMLNLIILPPRSRCFPQGLFSMYQTPPQMPEHNPSHYSCSDSLLADDGLVTVKASEDRTISLEMAILVFFFSDSVRLACAFSPFVSSYRAIFVSALRSWEDAFCSMVELLNPVAGLFFSLCIRANSKSQQYSPS